MAKESEITVEQWQETFVGYIIRGCALRSKGIYYFILEEIPSEDGTASGEDRLAIYVEQQRPDTWSHTKLTGFSGPRLAVAQKPKPQAIVTGGIANVFYIGSGESGVEPEPLPFGAPSVRSIAGSVFAVGGIRDVAHRTGAGRWQLLSKGIKKPKSISDLSLFGFQDISGFSESDIYAVGGAGDVWHWNGTTWRQCSFPSNVYLRTVLCANNGNVYITGQEGVVFLGKGDQWKLISEPNSSLYYNDTVFYEDKIWLASDAGLFYLNDEHEVQAADLPPRIHVTTGFLSVGDGLMLSAGNGGISLYDGKNWKVLVNHFEMKRIAERSSHKNAHP